MNRYFPVQRAVPKVEPGGERQARRRPGGRRRVRQVHHREREEWRAAFLVECRMALHSWLTEGADAA